MGEAGGEGLGSVRGGRWRRELPGEMCGFTELLPGMSRLGSTAAAELALII